MQAGPELHPQAKAILQRIITSNEPPFETMTPQQARDIADPRVIATAGRGPEIGEISETETMVAGRRVGLRIYRPRPQIAGPTPLPLLIYYHGGGFVVGNLDTVDTLCRTLVNAVGCIIVSVDYSLAPEHKFPAAVEDAFGAAEWVFAHVGELGGDPSRVAIAGESSGGALSAVVPQMAKAAGKDWNLVLQVLIYPATDMRAESASYRRLSEGYFLTQKKMRWFIEHYLENPEQAKDPRASPLLSEDVSGLPPALVITADLDPLVDEGNAYARRLEEAGVPTELHCFEGWPHGFAYWQGTEAHDRMYATVIGALRRAFATT